MDAAAVARLAAAGVTDAADPSWQQQQADLLQPSALFDAYARAKNLTTAVVEAGEALVRQAAAELHRTASPPIHLELGAVTVEGYGSFARRIEYPLAARGMLLLRGMHSERDAAAASNAAASDAVEASLFESGDGIRESGPNLDEVAATGGALRDDFGDDILDGMGDGVGDGDEMMASNGAGKTTLAMAPLWALTGGTDVRADGKPMESRGVINDGAARAVVTLRGTVRQAPASFAPRPAVSAGPDPTAESDEASEVRVAPPAALDVGAADGEQPPLPFEVVRTMGKREHTLRFTLGDSVYEGTLAQVQEQLDMLLRADQLSRVCFFGQHLGGGLLDKTDASLKADLQSLLPLDVWEELREEARRRAVAARDESARLEGEAAATERAAAQLAAKISGVRDELAQWEAGREARVRAQQEELSGLELPTLSDLSDQGDGSAAQAHDGDPGTRAEEGNAEELLPGARAASESAAAALASRREAATTESAELQRRVRAAFAAAQDATEAVMAADAVAREESSRLEALRQRAKGLKATVRSWGWGKGRFQAAKEAMVAGKEARRLMLEAAALNVPGLLEAAKAAGGWEAEEDPPESAEGAEEEGVNGGEGVAPMAQRLARALETTALEMRARAVVAGQQLAESMQATGESCSSVSADGLGGVCDSCGQPVTAEHLCERREALERAAAEADAAAAEAEAAARSTRSAADGAQLAVVQAELSTILAEEGRAVRALEIAEEARSSRQEKLAETQSAARRAEEEAAAALSAAEAEVAALVASEREAAARLAALTDLAAEQEQKAAVLALRVSHARAALEKLRAETNPHRRRLEDGEAELEALEGHRTSLEKLSAEASSSASLHSELQEHFGKRGVQNLLYTVRSACSSLLEALPRRAWAVPSALTIPASLRSPQH